MAKKIDWQEYQQDPYKTDERQISIIEILSILRNAICQALDTVAVSIGFIMHCQRNTKTDNPNNQN
ncbi:hypothetical protein [Bacteroides salyersiae]|uniref:hypothetical protein n=1 Tax=Bacteroides salyersiae TaxID=291644 RepID=UPI001C8B5E85|nr:hypothetical protein [Bacteroides salyersiae]